LAFLSRPGRIKNSIGLFVAIKSNHCLGHANLRWVGWSGTYNDAAPERQGQASNSRNHILFSMVSSG
jgi:hypothetical protein